MRCRTFPLPAIVVVLLAFSGVGHAEEVCRTDVEAFRVFADKFGRAVGSRLNNGGSPCGWSVYTHLGHAIGRLRVKAKGLDEATVACGYALQRYFHQLAMRIDGGSADFESGLDAGLVSRVSSCELGLDYAGLLEDLRRTAEKATPEAVGREGDAFRSEAPGEQLLGKWRVVRITKSNGESSEPEDYFVAFHADGAYSMSLGGVNKRVGAWDFDEATGRLKLTPNSADASSGVVGFFNDHQGFVWRESDLEWVFERP